MVSTCPAEPSGVGVNLETNGGEGELPRVVAITSDGAAGRFPLPPAPSRGLLSCEGSERLIHNPVLGEGWVAGPPRTDHGH